MILQRLVIAPKNIYSPVSENNPYQCEIQASYNDTEMKVKLPPEVAEQVIRLVHGVVGAAAGKQVQEFADFAIASIKKPLIEATSQEIDA